MISDKAQNSSVFALFFPCHFFLWTSYFSHIAWSVQWWIKLNILFEIWCVKISSPFMKHEDFKGKRCRRCTNSTYLHWLICKKYVSMVCTETNYVNKSNAVFCRGMVLYFFQEVSITNKSTMLRWVACKRLSSFYWASTLIYTRNFTEYKNANHLPQKTFTIFQIHHAHINTYTVSYIGCHSD